MVRATVRRSGSHEWSHRGPTPDERKEAPMLPPEDDLGTEEMLRRQVFHPEKRW